MCYIVFIVLISLQWCHIFVLTIKQVHAILCSKKYILLIQILKRFPTNRVMMHMISISCPLLMSFRDVYQSTQESHSVVVIFY